jgi:heat shock protein HslJ
MARGPVTSTLTLVVLLAAGCSPASPPAGSATSPAGSPAGPVGSATSPAGSPAGPVGSATSPAGSPAGPVGSAASAPAGVGTGTFRAVAVTENGKPRELVAGTGIELILRDGTLAAYAGCNHLTAEVRVTGAAELVVSGLATTDKACRPALARQDAWLADLLQARPAWSRAGDRHVLRGATAEITFAT